MEKQKTKNQHSWIFAHLGRFCDQTEIMNECRKLVYKYSKGRTNSLSVLYNTYPHIYIRMKQDLSQVPDQHQTSEQLDKARKRLMAVIFERLKQQGNTTASYDYVKKVACKAAKANNFNSIPLPILQSLYRKFGEINQEEWIKELKELI